MPVVSIRCASEKLRKRDEVLELSIEDCLACAKSRDNDCQYTYELLQSMYGTIQDREDRISTTTLTGPCARKTVLERRLPLTIDPDSLWAAFKGTMYHGQLEKYADGETNIEEARFHAHYGGNTISGSPDLVDVKNGILYDYKTTKSVPRFNYVYSDHNHQLNVNRWLVDNAHTVEWRGEEYDLSKPENQKHFVPDEWKHMYIVYMDDQGCKTIEATRSEQVPKANGKGTKKARVADIWSDEEVEKWLNDHYWEVKNSFDNDTFPDIPDNMQGWEHPFCNYCGVRATCIAAAYDQPVDIRRQ